MKILPHLTSKQLAGLGNWGLEKLLRDPGVRNEFVQYAYQSYAFAKGQGNILLPYEVMELLRTKALSHPAFIATVKSKAGYLNTKNHQPGGTYFKLATLFSTRIVNINWNAIKH